MKIGTILTDEQRERIYSSTQPRELADIAHNQETGSYSIDDVEYPTEDEAYEAFLEME